MNDFVKYEVLFSDLKNHLIGDYFKTRDFKVFLKNNDAHLFWSDLYNEAKNERTYYSIGMDAEKTDSLDAFKKVLVLSGENEKVANFTTQLIINFIENKKYKADFTDVIESINLSDFSKENCNEIARSIEKFNGKDLPEKDLPVKKIVLKAAVAKTSKKSVFVVHGHNKELELETARTLQILGLNAVILHEKANSGRTIIEKIEKHSEVSFAVILLTADDLGKTKNDLTLKSRARQNVILESGYFLAKLGRENLMFLREKDVELPSDVVGIGYTDYDQSGKWKSDLVKELKASGFNVDANKLYE